MSTKVFIASRFEEFVHLRRALAHRLRVYTPYEVIALDDGRAATADPRSRSLSSLDEAALVVLLLGDTYSDAPGPDRSITHAEYERATAAGKRVLAFTTTRRPSDPRQAEFLRSVQSTVGLLAGDVAAQDDDVDLVLECIDRELSLSDASAGAANAWQALLREMSTMGADGVDSFHLSPEQVSREPTYNQLIERRRMAFRALAADEGGIALQELEAAQDLHPLDWATNYVHARLLELRGGPGDLQAALPRAERAAKVVEDLDHAPCSLTDVDEVRRRRRASTFLCHGRLLRKAGSPVQALRHLELSLEQAPSREAMAERVRAAAACGDESASRRAVLEMLPRYPDATVVALRGADEELRPGLERAAVEFVAQRARSAGLDLDLTASARLRPALQAFREGVAATGRAALPLADALLALTDVERGGAASTWTGDRLQAELDAAVGEEQQAAARLLAWRARCEEAELLHSDVLGRFRASVQALVREHAPEELVPALCSVAAVTPERLPALGAVWDVVLPSSAPVPVPTPVPAPGPALAPTPAPAAVRPLPPVPPPGARAPLPEAARADERWAAASSLPAAPVVEEPVELVEAVAQAGSRRVRAAQACEEAVRAHDAAQHELASLPAAPGPGRRSVLLRLVLAYVAFQVAAVVCAGLEVVVDEALPQPLLDLLPFPLAVLLFVGTGRVRRRLRQAKADQARQRSTAVRDRAQAAIRVAADALRDAEAEERRAVQALRDEREQREREGMEARAAQLAAEAERQALQRLHEERELEALEARAAARAAAAVRSAAAVRAVQDVQPLLLARVGAVLELDRRRRAAAERGADLAAAARARLLAQERVDQHERVVRQAAAAVTGSRPDGGSAASARDRLARELVARLRQAARAASQFPPLARADYVPVSRASSGEVTRVRPGDDVVVAGGLLAGGEHARLVRVVERTGRGLVVSDLTAWVAVDPEAGEEDAAARRLADYRALEVLLVEGLAARTSPAPDVVEDERVPVA